MAVLTRKQHTTAVQLHDNTALASLPTDSGKRSAGFNNVPATTHLKGYPYGTLTLTLGALPNVPANVPAFVYFLRSRDGTTYEDGDTNVTPQREAEAVCYPRAVMAAQVVDCVANLGETKGTTRVPIPAGHWKALFVWPDRGTILGAAGNSLDVLVETDETA